MPDSLTKFRELLRELFQLDNADLDFGIYRIMNMRRDEITRFLDHELLPQVKDSFKQYQSSDVVQLTQELNRITQQLKDAGVDPEMAPKVKQLREQLTGSVDVAALEQQIFSDLYAFFNRYYDEGDFLSLRRYKEGIYAIPYEGEEVKLHWANHDQYYIKSSEYLRDYAFVLPNGKRVHFRLMQADAEKDNNKAANGNDRRFILVEVNPVEEVAGELIVRFEYRSDDQRRKQTALNEHAEQRILELAAPNWAAPLAANRAESTADPKPSVLRHHLGQYTARNTFDYFIHKDLGGFLRRELDFFIKNEVMHLDDIESQDAPKVEQYLSRIKVLRTIAHKIITFLAQIEDFQKRLWRKKKFVVRTDWLVTVDRLTPALRDIVATNERQWARWEALGFKPEEMPLGSPPWGTRAYLDANDKLVVDTSLLDMTFAVALLQSDAILAGQSSVDAATSGLLVKGENFQALSLLKELYRGRISCVYIDPPYNTGSDGFAYKDAYQHSSWLSMVSDRIACTEALLSRDGVFLASIDDGEAALLRATCDGVFGPQNRIANLVWKGATDNNPTRIAVEHEYVCCYAKDKASVPEEWSATSSEVKGFMLDSFEEMRSKTTTLSERQAAFERFAEENRERLGDLYRYRRIDEQGPYAARRNMENPGKPGPRYDVLHPVTGKPCTVPAWGWRYSESTMKELLAEGRIIFGDTEEKIPELKVYLRDVRFPLRSVVHLDARKGSNALDKLFGSRDVFKNPKPYELLNTLFPLVTDGTARILDFFAGSGTTAHAVIELNRADGGRRSFILAEMGEHFDTVLLPRVSKVMYSPDWKDGRAQVHGKGVSGLVKVLRLEGYEDTLNNLHVLRRSGQQAMLDDSRDLREEYTLGYMLETETRGSPSLLNTDQFSDPFTYTLNVATGTVGETRAANVDLAETFNWLLGLRVDTMDTIKGIRVITGTNPQGEKVLVLWRKTADWPNDKLDQWLFSQKINPRDMEFDLIYVNGDNNLENLKKDEETWKVRLIEEEFQRLMFDVQDV